MDRISGLLPQIGWSPLSEAPPPAKAPASTVEPPHGAARAGGGANAGVDTHSGQPRAPLRPPAHAGGGQGNEAASAPDAPDADQPTGPAPTFELTYLEAQALRRRADPLGAAERPENPSGAAGETRAATRPPAPDPSPDQGEDNPVRGNRADAPPAWPRLEDTPPGKLDLTR